MLSILPGPSRAAGGLLFLGLTLACAGPSGPPADTPLLPGNEERGPVTEVGDDEPEPVAATDPRSGWEPDTACAFLADAGLPTRGWKNLGAGYSCTSDYLNLGAGALPNNLAYYASGDADEATELKLVLNVNQPAAGAKAHAALAKRADQLVRAATGEAMPAEAAKAISDGAPGAWFAGGATVDVVRDDWPTGRGYEVRFVVQTP